MLSLSTFLWLALLHFTILGFYSFSTLSKFRQYSREGETEYAILTKTAVMNKLPPEECDEELLDLYIEESVPLLRRQRAEWEGIVAKNHTLFFAIWILSFAVFGILLSD